MYAAVRQYKSKPGMADHLAEKVKELVPVISGVSGFMGYYVIYAPDDTVTAISIFNKVEEAEESNRRALAWIEKHLAPYVVAGVIAEELPHEGDVAQDGDLDLRLGVFILEQSADDDGLSAIDSHGGVRLALEQQRTGRAV